MFGFNGIHHRLIGGIAIAFKTVHFGDLELTGLEKKRRLRTGDMFGLQVEIDGKASLLQAIDGFGDSIVGKRNFSFL